jgi:3-methyladenine DNA glycosylase AlkC
MAGVPASIRAALASGEIETVNLMEWLAADMAALAVNVASKARSDSLRFALQQAASEIQGQSITGRLKTLGRAVANASAPFDPDFQSLAIHQSDLVRQWACYAVNEPSLGSSLSDRLALTLPFAADRNMSVREAAWMAFRPHIIPRVDEALDLLMPLTLHNDANIRRFAIEVTRPRSVWGVHIDSLKREPKRGLNLLQNVRRDPARYVRQSAGNWLNDASKSRPEWVAELCARWSLQGHPSTQEIVRRALRTINAPDKSFGRGKITSQMKLHMA